MLPYRDSVLTKIALGIFFLLIIGYAYYEAQGLLFGPSITVSSQVTEVHQPFITVSGTAAHIASLSMNGKAVPVTESGAFSEPYLLAPGDNRIVLDAKDTYGHVRTQVLQIVYTPDSSSSQAATSTVSTATSTQMASTSPMAQ